MSEQFELFYELHKNMNDVTNIIDWNKNWNYYQFVNNLRNFKLDEGTICAFTCPDKNIKGLIIGHYNSEAEVVSSSVVTESYVYDKNKNKVNKRLVCTANNHVGLWFMMDDFRCILTESLFEKLVKFHWSDINKENADYVTDLLIHECRTNTKLDRFVFHCRYGWWVDQFASPDKIAEFDKAYKDMKDTNPIRYI